MPADGGDAGRIDDLFEVGFAGGLKQLPGPLHISPVHLFRMPRPEAIVRRHMEEHVAVF